MAFHSSTFGLHCPPYGTWSMCSLTDNKLSDRSPCIFMSTYISKATKRPTDRLLQNASKYAVTIRHSYRMYRSDSCVSFCSQNFETSIPTWTHFQIKMTSRACRKVRKIPRSLNAVYQK